MVAILVVISLIIAEFLDLGVVARLDRLLMI